MAVPNRIRELCPALGGKRGPLDPVEQAVVDGLSARGPAGPEPVPGTPTDEEQLVALLKAYDEDAIRSVYRQHANGIYRFALYQTADEMLAEDVVGEVFARMIESIPSYTYRGTPISAYLYRIARNLIVDHQRRNGRVRPLEEADPSRLVGPNPISSAESDLGWAELAGLLEELTDEQRQVIVLKFVEDLDNREVAEIIGKNEGSVKSLQHRALRSLRRLLDRQGQHER
jgi:RNA polymerase sigma-70 factor (ECF subfamily)